MTGHLLDTGKSWTGNLVAAESGVDADENTGLLHKVSIEFQTAPTAEMLTSLLL